MQICFEIQISSKTDYNNGTFLHSKEFILSIY